MTKACAGIAAPIVEVVGGKEAAFTLTAAMVVDAILQGKKISFKGPKSLTPYVNKAASNVLDYFNIDAGVSISCTESSDLKLSGKPEALSVATTLSLVGELARTRGSVNELKVDKYLRDQFFIIDDHVVQKDALFSLCVMPSLSFAKTAASFYGGFAVSSGNKILRSGEMEELYGVFIPSRGDAKHLPENVLKFERELIWDEAYKGNLYAAMNLSALIHSTGKTHEVVKELLSRGVLAVSCEGKTFLLLSRSQKALDAALKGVSLGKVGNALSTLNEGARVLENPRRVYRVNEFLTIAGSSGYRIFSY